MWWEPIAETLHRLRCSKPETRSLYRGCCNQVDKILKREIVPVPSKLTHLEWHNVDDLEAVRLGPEYEPNRVNAISGRTLEYNKFVSNTTEQLHFLFALCIVFPRTFGL